MQVEGLREDLPRRRLQVGVAQAAQTIARIEHAGADAEAGHGLGQFQPDRTGAEHGEGGGQILDVEHGIGGENPLPQIPQRLRHARTGAGRQHRRLEAQAGVIVDAQAVRPLEHSPARQARLVRELFKPLEDGADEMVAQAPQPREHRRPVDAYRADVDPQAMGRAGILGGFGGGDQEFRGHAADTGAGGAAGPLLDQNRFRPR